jgi:hypothetical protein
MANSNQNQIEYQNILETISKNIEQYNQRKKIAITEHEKQEIDQRVIKLTWQLQEISKKIDNLNQRRQINNNNEVHNNILVGRKEVENNKTNRYKYDKLGNLLDRQEIGKSLSYSQPEWDLSEYEKKELYNLIDSVGSKNKK